ncbi:MAG TPA: choice-of-anchor Q domain-containing protein [Anaerolineaceae bacterium]|nr:choice-of-anchor Q domain-containing protein [Anaerolineaceae bacterium]
MNTRNSVLTVLTIAVLLFLNLGMSSANASPTVAQTQSTTLFVKQGEAGDCYSWDTACDLQAALALAEAGDQVWVAAGTYKPTTDTDRTVTFLLESGVAIYGGFPDTGEPTWAQRDWEANLTTLSGDIGTEAVNTDNSFHVVTGSGVDTTAILDGFTITAANANGGFPAEPVGGGMYLLNSSPTLKNVIISGNLAAYGGGIYNNNGSPTLTNVDFSNNTVVNRGGGMYNLYSSNPALTNVTFSSNSAGNGGGGMYNYTSCSPALTNVTFSGNTVSGNGGGMLNFDHSSPTLNNVVFSENTATTWGGGIHNSSNSNSNLTNVLFSGNSAGDAGGGMVNEHSNPTITHTTFSNNTAYNGGGMGNSESSPTLINVTFSDNTATVGGGGMSNYYFSGIMTNVTFYGNAASSTSGGGAMKSERSSPTVTNSIFWGNTPDQLSFIVHSYPVITYSIIQGETVWEGEGNINTDPLLEGLADNGGFTQTHALGDMSSAIDAGSPTLCPAMDQRGFHRPIDGDENTSEICDIGAYEYNSYPEVFTLTVDTEGSGLVALDPDKTEFQFGEIVSLTASADPGWSFSGWSGDTAGTTNPLTISILDDTSITANFEQVIFKIYLPLIVR